MHRDDARDASPDPGQPLSTVMSRLLLRVDTDTTLGEARGRMAKHGIHHLLVFDGERLVGVISDRDLLAHLSPKLGTLAEQRHDTATLLRRVFHAASYRPVTLPQRASLAAGAAIMLRHKISCLPVTNAGGVVVGVVTSRDLLGALSRMRPAA